MEHAENRFLQTVDSMERETGIEPATSSLGSWHSTAELLPRRFFFNNFQTAFHPEH